MIVTVTLNAALDRTLVAPHFTIGESRGAIVSLSLGGGKGFNVARTLHCLGVPVLALGFAGGLVGELMRRALDEEELPYDLTPIARESRVCTAILDPETGSATEVNESGPPIGHDEQQAFLRSFDSALDRAQVVVLSGSLPEGLPDTFYAQLIARAHAAGIPCLLDTKGVPLQAGVQAAPLLVKPNQHEAAQLFGGTFDPEDASFVRRHLPHPGPALLCLTLGADGAVLHGPSGSWRAYPPRVQVVDTVGAGDSFVGGLAAALLRAMEQQGVPGQRWIDRAVSTLRRAEVVEEMLRQASATAVAGTLLIGAGRCDRATVERLLPQVRIHSLA